MRAIRRDGTNHSWTVGTRRRRAEPRVFGTLNNLFVFIFWQALTLTSLLPFASTFHNLHVQRAGLDRVFLSDIDIIPFFPFLTFARR